jgi:hypothetical protein
VCRFSGEKAGWELNPSGVECAGSEQHLASISVTLQCVENNSAAAVSLCRGEAGCELELAVVVCAGSDNIFAVRTSPCAVWRTSIVWQCRFGGEKAGCELNSSGVECAGSEQPLITVGVTLQPSCD